MRVTEFAEGAQLNPVSVCAGWLLFMVFAGVGFVALPLDLIRDFIGRPKATITHSEYIKRAKALGVRAKAVKVDTVPSLLADEAGIGMLLLISCWVHNEFGLLATNEPW